MEDKNDIDSNDIITYVVDKFLLKKYSCCNISRKDITLKNWFLLKIYNIKQWLFWRNVHNLIGKFLRKYCKLNDLSFIEKTIPSFFYQHYSEEIIKDLVKHIRIYKYGKTYRERNK